MDKKLFNQPVDTIIDELTQKVNEVPAWDVLKKKYEPKLHKITTDNVTRKDKVRKDGSIEKAARIYIGLEKLLAKRTNEFMFALPVSRTYSNTENNETRQAIARAIEAIYKNARINSENKQRGLAYFASCEVLTIWYAVESPNTLYGFNSKWKLKCKSYSPMNGTDLFPHFDENDDMDALSFRYQKRVGDQKRTFFETYTADRHYKWMQGDDGWVEKVNEEIKIGKIPGVYVSSEEPIYQDLSELREDIEYTISRNSDVIAYNAAPLLKIIGNLQGREDKGESQRVYRMEQGGDIGYVAWEQAIQALSYQVQTEVNLFWSQGQMPDISFQNMKDLGDIGYDARQTLFMDAHLKIGDEEGEWIRAFERECNIIKSFLKLMNVEWANEIDNVGVDHFITPFQLKSEEAEISKYTKANGGKPVISQQESIQLAGLSSDPIKTMELIEQEEAEAMQRAASVPTDVFQ